MEHAVRPLSESKLIICACRWCRAKLSATSYTLVGFLNKIVSVAINVVIWSDAPWHAPGSRHRTHRVTVQMLYMTD